MERKPGVSRFLSVQVDDALLPSESTSKGNMATDEDLRQPCGSPTLLEEAKTMTIHQSATMAFADMASTGFLEPPTATPLTGEIETWTTEMFAYADQGSSVGFWKASVGRSHWVFDYNEVIHIIEGRLRVTEEGGESIDLGPGDVAVFPLGWKGEWDVLEELKKFYVVFP